MRSWRLISAVLLAVCAAGSAAQGEPPVFPSGTEVVVLDLVATDGKGRPVSDLRAEEVEVAEDGRTCAIRGFRLVRAAVPPTRVPTTAAAPTVAGTAEAPGATPTRPSLVVLLFDRLTTAGAPLARKGGLDLVAREFPADTWFAVFKVGYGIRLLASFTTDRARIERAIEQATLGDPERSAVPISAGPVLAPLEGTPPGMPPGIPPSADGGQVPEVEAATARLEQTEWAQVAGGRGLDSLYAVLGVARALGNVQGRKAVVYFAEGWHLPVDTYPQVRQAYGEAISSANRANVAVHTVDARGLTSHKPMGLTAMDSVLDAFTADNRDGPGEGAYTPCDGAGGTAGKSCGQTGGFNPKPLPGSLKDRLEGPNLERLADDTGGLAIAGTNDLGSGLSRVAQELRQYYEIVYAPANPAQDGRFRRISVKLSRPGVRVRTRSGYFATPRSAPSVAAYELPLIDTLAAAEPARGFSLHADVLHFAPGPEGARECVVLAEVPLSEVQLVSDETQGVYRARLSLLGHVKDETGAVVARLTHDWPIEGPLAEREVARTQGALFRQRFVLAPGRYRLEVAVHDGNGGGRAVVRQPFEIPGSAAGLALGSPVVVKRASRAASDGVVSDPLVLGAVAFLPALGEPVVTGPGRELPVLVSVYPSPQGGSAALAVELHRDGEVLAEGRPELAPPDASGRAAWVGGVPVAGLAPGPYELVVRARQGGVALEERAKVELAALPPAAVPQAPAPARSVDPALTPVLERAGRYVVDYQGSFQNIVAEEAYLQRARLPTAPAGADPKRLLPSGNWVTTEIYQERRTRADLVFVRLAGDIPWGLFRDVFELDGKEVRDRDERLQRLFQQPSPSALEQARRILDESARYNIGGAERTANIPTLPLVFLLPSNQGRFSFQAGEPKRIAGSQAVEVRFEEVSRPTLVKDSRGGDLPARGRFWIDPGRGHVLRSEVVFRFEPDLAEGKIETDYQAEPRLGIWVPREMRESYENLPGAARLVFPAPTHTRARYSKLRQFAVTSDESFRASSETPHEGP